MNAALKSSGPKSSKFSRGESIGLALDCLAGVASAVAAAIILVFIFHRLYREGWSSWEALDVSVITLFLAELVQGISLALDLKWVIEGQAYTSAFCTGQAAMQQLGQTSVALATLTIAVQTFLTIWWLKLLDRTISLIVILSEVVFVILFVAIGFGLHTHPPKEYYGTPAPYWCWLGDAFTGERIAGEYVWFWLTLFISLALYAPLALLHFNVIEPGTRTSWLRPKADLSRTHPPRVGIPGGEQDAGQLSGTREPSRGLPSTPSDALSRNIQLWSTILYPTLYCVVILPLSVVRWITFGEEQHAINPPRRPVETFIVAILFGLSGVFNALLYALTRSKLFRPGGGVQVPKPPVLK